MSDELRAAEALAALQQLDASRIEYKSDVAPAVLDIDNRDVTTLFSVDCLDTVGDITPVSAFQKSIAERGHTIPHLYMHDLNAPAIARIMSFSTLRRAELPTDVQTEHPDATGGVACVSRYLKSGRGAEVYDGIREGVPYQASFGYQVLRAEQKSLATGRRARFIRELRLWEVSTTPPGHAANMATRVRLGKALAVLEELKAGKRHSLKDIDFLNQIAALVLELGASNIVLIDAAPAAVQSRTSSGDELLSSLHNMFEVQHDGQYEPVHGAQKG